MHGEGEYRPRATVTSSKSGTVTKDFASHNGGAEIHVRDHRWGNRDGKQERDSFRAIQLVESKAGVRTQRSPRAWPLIHSFGSVAAERWRKEQRVANSSRNWGLQWDIEGVGAGDREKECEGLAQRGRGMHRTWGVRTWWAG